MDTVGRHKTLKAEEALWRKGEKDGWSLEGLLELVDELSPKALPELWGQTLLGA
jgi:hypothetical protein